MEKQQTGLQRFNSTITNPRTQDYLQSVLGERKKSFVNNLTALVANSTALQECDALGVMYAAIKATALDLPLDPNLGFAYVIPYKNNKTGKIDAQFQIGYKGYIQLGMRSGQFKTINVRDVREGEIIGEDFVSGELQFKKVPNREKAVVIGYVAFFRLVNGFEKMSFWTTEEIKSHALKYSKTYSSKIDTIKDASKWTTDFDAMAKKTAIKLLLSKYAPLSIEMQSAIKSDQAILSDKGEEYIDNPVEEVNAEEISTTEEVKQRKQQLQSPIDMP